DALTAELSKAAVERSGAEGILQGARKALEEEQKALEAARETLCQKTLELKRCGGDMTGTEIREKADEIRSKDNRTAIMKKTYEKIKEKVTCLEEDYQKIKENQTSLLLGLHSLEGKINTIREDLKSREEKLKSLTGGYAAQELLGKVREQIRALKDNVEKAAAVRDKKAKEREKAAQNLAEVQAAYTALQDNKTRLSEVIDARVRKNLFASRIEAREALLPGPEQEALEREIGKYREERTRLQLEQKRLEEILGEERITKENWLILEEEFSRLKLEAEKARENRVRAEKDLEDLKDKHARWQELEKERKKMVERQEKLEDLKRLFAGNAFVEYVAEEKLASVALEASSRLGSLTRHRYALEVDGEGGFVIRDDANGGLRRPVNSLSGGETFLASLALALALSTQVQLKGRYPLEFFFLDEGFGSLDQETLELALNTLEKLRLEQLTVGVISHVPEIRTRLPRRLIVEPPRPGVSGTRVRLEQA
ncbi:MAG TPA: hypothetical protein GX697_01370, partial [Firmicutes bacterium]|nr:hypothetical protein [Bacillota bacterium]